MKKISGKQIRAQLKSIWPDIYTLNTDSEFIVPGFEQVKQIVNENSLAMQDFVDNIFECDDVSIMLWARIKEARIKQIHTGQLPQNEQFSWPFGICFGVKFRNYDGPHWQNLCIVEQGILMIEPQLDEFWQAKYPDNDVRFALI